MVDDARCIVRGHGFQRQGSALGSKDEDLQSLVGKGFEVNARCAAQLRALGKFDVRSGFLRVVVGEHL